MSYFKNFPNSVYKFANDERAVMQNLSAYAEVMDEIKTNGAFYQDYYIRNGDRPDNVAFTLYENPKLHWTFYLMNDRLRESGWPLDHTEIVKKAKVDFPNHTLTTTDSLIAFQVGDTVQDYITGATGVVLSKNLSMGQLVVEKTNNSKFTIGNLLTRSGGTEQATLTGSSPEYLAAKYYLQDEEIITCTEDLIQSSFPVEVTNLDYYTKENDDLRRISVLKPRSVNTVVQMFNQAIISL